MLITKKIKIKTTNKNISYYKKLGFDVKSGDEIEVTPEQLPYACKLKVDVKCDICKKIKNITIFSYNRNIEQYGYYACSSNCSCEKMVEIGKSQCNTKCINKVDESHEYFTLIEEENQIDEIDETIINESDLTKNEQIKQKVFDIVLNKYNKKSPIIIEEILKEYFKNKLKIDQCNNVYYLDIYEKEFLDKYSDIIEISRIEPLEYKLNNKTYKYYPDFFIKELNLIVDIKSINWCDEFKKIDILKKCAYIKAGYKYMIINGNYEMFEKIIQYKIYSKYDVCYQYKIKLDNKKESPILNVNDFEFKYIDSDDKLMCERIKNFIVKYEWLGTMPNRPTHRFVAMYKGEIGAVVIMSTPNAFTKLLGDDTKDIEKLISRGASASWTPKNIGSSLIMFGIKWMVKNTQFRLFSAYSDVEAKELGTIYQSCNFTYLGKNFGADMLYFDLEKPDNGWFNRRRFNKRSNYKKICKDNNIEWKPGWNVNYSIKFELMDEYTRNLLKNTVKSNIDKMVKRVPPKKHKYIYILGIDNRETKMLRNKFKLNNPTLVNLKYPKKRGE